MAKRLPLTKKFKAMKMEKIIFELVSTKGVSKTICLKQLQLPPNYFSRYEGADVNFDSALATFTTEVLMKHVTKNLGYSGAERKYLMQKLRVFDKEIELPIKKMTTAKHASENLSFALNAFARKELGEEGLQAIRQACDVFSNLMTSTVLEEKIGDLERLMEEKFNGQNSRNS